MLKRFNLILVFLFLIFNSFSFTQDISPTNNSIVSNLNISIQSTISGGENTSTWINWGNSLIGYWNFDSGNSTHAFDLSGKNNHGEYQGDSFNSTGGIRGINSEFDGNGDRVMLGDLDSLGGNSELTISLWFNADFLPVALNDNDGLFTQHEDWDNYINIRFNGNTRYLSAATENSGVLSVAGFNYSGNITTGSWHHIIYMFNLGNSSIYLDGNLKKINNNSGFTSTPNLAADVTIGSLSTIAASHFDGSIDEVMVFNRTLSQFEIDSLYNSQINNLQFNATNLNNLTTYSYEIFTINTTGDLQIKSMSFFTNTSLSTHQETQSSLVSVFPSISILSLLFSLFIILLFQQN